MALLLSKIDEQESQLTAEHLELFLRGSVLTRTTERGKQRYYDAFKAHRGVAAAAEAFGVPAQRVVLLGNALVRSGELACQSQPALRLFADNDETYYFTTDVMVVRSATGAVAARGIGAVAERTGFFPAFLVERPLTGVVNHLSVPPVELARQLALAEHALLGAVTLGELDGAYKDAQNVAALQEHTNRVSLWVSSAIVVTYALELRKKIVKYFVELADACRALRNYHGMYAVYVGLMHPAVRRLTQTFGELGHRTQHTFDALCVLCDESHNYAEYRRLLDSPLGAPPCVPIAAPLLRAVMTTHDQAALADGVPARERLLVLARAYRALLTVKNSGYLFKRSRELQALIAAGLSTIQNGHLMKFSLVCQPDAQAAQRKQPQNTPLL